MDDEGEVPSSDTAVLTAEAEPAERSRKHRRRLVAGGIALAVVLTAVAAAVLSASREPSKPAFQPYMSSGAANWQVDWEALPTQASTSISVNVIPIGCSEFGSALAPRVELGPDQVIITIDLEPSLVSSFVCAISTRPPVTVDLDEPLGDRTLVDGRCLTGGEPAICGSDGAIRWQLPGPEGVEVPGIVKRYDSPGQYSPVVATIRAVDSAGETVTTGETDEYGLFTLHAPNGSFELITEPASRPDGTAPQCPASVPIDVVGLPIRLQTIVCPF